MTVGEMLGGGARLVRTQPRALALWALLYLAAMGVMLALFWPAMVEMTEFQRQMIAGDAGGPPPVPPGNFLGAIVVADLALLLAVVAIFAAAVRAVARGGDDRFGFLRVGKDELRLVGLAFLLWLIATLAMIVFMIVAGLLTAALAAAAGDAASVAFGLLWLLAIPAIVWVEVRISLAGAFTVLSGRITVRTAWRATRGRFWTLLGAYLVIGLIYVVVTLLLTAIAFPQLFGLYATMIRTSDPGTMLAAQQAMFAAFAGPRMIVAMVVGTAVNTALAGWLFGAMATAAVALDASDRSLAA